LLVVGSLLLVAATFLAGRGDVELGVGYRSEEGEAACPDAAADGAICTRLAVVNTWDAPQGALCELVGSYRHSWLTGGGPQLRIDTLRPWYSAQFTLVVEPDHPGSNSYHEGGVRCIAT
jgi:hypothetical protein